MHAEEDFNSDLESLMFRARSICESVSLNYGEEYDIWEVSVIHCGKRTTRLGVPRIALIRCLRSIAGLNEQYNDAEAKP